MIRRRNRFDDSNVYSDNSDCSDFFGSAPSSDDDEVFDIADGDLSSEISLIDIEDFG